MNYSDFVFNQIYKGSLKAGADEYNSHQQAVIGLDDYKKGKNLKSKVSQLIKDRIAKAKKNTKKVKKA